MFQTFGSMSLGQSGYLSLSFLSRCSLYCSYAFYAARNSSFLYGLSSLLATNVLDVSLLELLLLGVNTSREIPVGIRQRAAVLWWYLPLLWLR